MILLCKDGSVVKTTKADIESSMAMWKDERKKRVSTGFYGPIGSRSTSSL
jgi:hypothetical protein